ncbi:hypothetical protein ACP70R_010916 [Stipagrostis hirtigluma subsp. patula]
MQTTNTNTKTPAISSARIPGARKAAAAVSPSPSKLEASSVAPTELEKAKVSPAPPPPPPLALVGWGLQDPSSSDDDEDGSVRRAAAAPAAKKKSSKAKGRAPSKNKYLLSEPPPAAEAKAQEVGGDEFMPGAADLGLPSSFDPLADAARAEDAAAPKDVVHLRVQQRNGRKTLTTVQGLCAAYNYAKILRDLKRELCCSGIVVEDEELGNVIQLQGDHRKSVAAFLVRAGMVRKDNVKIHGF